MIEIHCHVCGGFIAELRMVAYRELEEGTRLAVPHSSYCTCVPPVLYGPPAGYASLPGIPAIGNSAR
jgi:hypothetical protein